MQDDTANVLHPAHRYQSPTLAHAHRRIVARYALTVGESRVFAPLAACHDEAEIAATLGMPLGTLRTHIRSILRKLGVETRRGIVRRFLHEVDLLAGHRLPQLRVVPDPSPLPTSPQPESATTDR
jgi:DNA-binding NarL/FixJ family response regulator